MKRKLVISFSGGRTSAYMTWWLLNHAQSMYEMIVVFANTSKEREETLQFIREYDRQFDFRTVWIESVTYMQNRRGVSARVVDFDTASRSGEPFEAFIQKHGIPKIGAPKCSRELKGCAIRAYARSIGWKGYYTAIGIRADERHRINLMTAKEQKLLYPLATITRTTKSDINLFWSKQPFDLKLKSYEGNCDLCWKKSIRKLMTIVSEHPPLADWLRSMENRYGDLILENSKGDPNIKTPIRFYRDNMTTDEIIEEAEFGFERATDESKVIDTWRQLAFFRPVLDGEEAGCTHSCESFG